MKNDIHDLGLVLESRVKLVVIESWDELRVLETLTGLAVKRGLGLHTWSVTEGLQRLGFGGASVDESPTLEPEAALRWLDTLWQVWTARYGHDEYMQRHMLVFMARILREASPDAAQADRAGRLLRTLSLAALAKNI